VDEVDERYLTDSLVELAKVSTAVPLGPDPFIEPDDPKLVHYVQDVLRPKIDALGALDVRDVPRNQLVIRYGEGKLPRTLLVMSYTPAQHHNLMEDPFSGRIAPAPEFGVPEPCVYGQGVSQNKAHQAVLLTVLKALVEQRWAVHGTLYLAVNNEGRSSHACTEAILASLERKPEFALLLVRTGLRIGLGNRGRVDVNVEVRGRATHSSTPHEGLSAIDGAHEVLTRLKRIPVGDPHPRLGPRHVIPYQVLFEPLAPHTLPEVARIRIDRRLLPGDDPDEAVSEVRRAIGDLSPYQVAVSKGPCMLPALVDPDHFGVQALRAAHERVLGTPPDTIYRQSTFDAGGACAAGVPAVMYGVAGPDTLLGVDFVPLSQVIAEARVVLHTIRSLLG
jgi:acetylornithine deacetylase/succinyl-diaminopimelate desuccinylase-like protein